MSIFSAGAVGFDIVAHVASKGFVEGQKWMSDTQGKAAKGAHMQIEGRLVKDGFERAGRQFRQTETEAKSMAGGVTKSFGTIDESMRVTSGIAAEFGGMIRRQLGLTRNEYLTVAEAAKATQRVQQEAFAKTDAAAIKAAAVQKKAMEEMTVSGGGRGGVLGPRGTKPFEDAGEKAGSAYGKGFKKMADVGKWVSLGAAAIGVVSVKVAADFQREMELVHTQAGYGQKSVDQLSKSIRGLAPAVGVGPKQLAEGLYHIASDGFPAARAMELLSKGAQLAKVGGSDLRETMYALVSLMKTAPKDIHSTTEAVAVMNEIVGKGDLHMQDFVKALGSGIVPAAKAAGLGLRDAGTALDIMTSRGVPAEQAATRLRTIFTLIAHPTAIATKALEEIGLQHDSLAKEFEKHGLATALEVLQQHLDKTFPIGKPLTIAEQKEAVAKYSKSLSEAGVEGLSAGKALNKFEAQLKSTGTAAIQQSNIISESFGKARTGTTMQILVQNIDDVRKHTEELNKPGGIEKFKEAWEATQKVFSVQVSKLWAGIQDLGIIIGDFLIPKLTKFAEVLGEVGHWIGHHNAILKALTVTISGVLTAAVLAFFTKVGVSIGRAIKEMLQFFGLVTDSPKKMAPMFDKMVGGFNAVGEAIDKDTIQLKLLEEQAMKTTAEMGKLAATGEAVTAGGVVLSGGLKNTSRQYSKSGKSYTVVPGSAGIENAPLTPAEEAAIVGASGGRGGIRGAAGKAGGFLSAGASRALRGGLTVLFGSMAAEIAGEMIPGAVGKGVEKAGKDAAIGAGIGTLFGMPIPGAIAGGLIGGIDAFVVKHSETEGQKIAHSVTKGMAPAVTKEIEKGFDDVEKNAKERERKLRSPHEPFSDKFLRAGGKIPVLGALFENPEPERDLTPAQRRAIKLKKEAEEGGLGSRTGTAIIEEQLKQTVGKGMGPNQAITSIIMEMKKRLSSKDLPEAAKAAAARTMLSLVEGLEEKKQLPRHSAAELKRAIAHEFSNLPKVLQVIGSSSTKAFADSIKGDKILTETRTFMNNLRNVYKGFERVPALSSENAFKYFKTAQEKLTKLEKEGPYLARLSAEEDHKKLKAFEKNYYATKRKTLEKDLKEENKKHGHLTEENKEHIVAIYGAMRELIEREVGLGLKSQKEATKELNKEFEAEMKALGVSPKELKKIASGLGDAVSTVTGALSNVKLATGGIPHPGSGTADDHYVVDPHGRPVAAISGTEGIVNTPQMGVINAALQISHALGAMPYESLHDLWGSGMTHYAKGGPMKPGGATSGYVNPVPGLILGRTDQGVDFAGKGPIYAIGNAHMTRVSPQNSGTGWPGAAGAGTGAMIVYQLLAGPDKGRYVYTAENIDPVRGLRVGANVAAGTQIASARGFYPFLEMGWSDASGVPTSHAEYTEGKVTVGGTAFGQFLSGLPGGKYKAGVASRPEPKKIPYAKWKGPGGAQEAIGNRIIHLTTDQANKKLHEQWMKTSGSAAAATPGGATTGTVAGPIVTASEFGGHNDPSAFGHSTASGKVANDSLWGFAELSNPPGSLNFAALGHLAMGTKINVGYQGKKITIPKVDVGAGGPGMGGFIRAIDLTYAAARALGAPGMENVSWARAARGGLLQSFAGGGMLPHYATGRAAKVKRGAVSRPGTKGPGPQKTIGIGHHKRNVNQRIESKLHPHVKKTNKTQLSKRSGKNVASAGMLAKIQKLDKAHITIPGLGTLDEVDAQIQAIDTQYTRDQAYFELIDVTLTPEDQKILTGLREKQLELVGFEKHAIESTGYGIDELLQLEHEGVINTQGEAKKLHDEIHRTKDKLKKEGRKLATLRHKKAGKMLKLAEDLAKHSAAAASKKETEVEKRRKIKEDYSKRKLHLREHKPQPQTARKAAIRDRAKTERSHARTKAQQQAISKREAHEIQGVEHQEKGAAKRHSDELIHLQRQEKTALHPLEAQDRKIKKEARHYKERETSARHKYQRQGWDTAWKIELERWKLKDALEKEETKQKELTGKADPTIQEILATTKGTIGERKKAEDEAAKASATGGELVSAADASEVEDAKDIASLDVQQGLPIPQNVLDILARAGLATPSGLEAYQKEPKKPGEPGAPGEEQGAPGTEAKTKEEIARAAIEDLAALDAASQSLFQQFGSNTASSAAVSGLLGGPARATGGVRYFGAAAAGLGGTGIQGLGAAPRFGMGGQLEGGGKIDQTFHQTNHFAEGPEHPHIFAERSALEFNTRFG